MSSLPTADQVFNELRELRAQVAELASLKTQLALLTTHLGQCDTQDPPPTGKAADR